MTPEEFRAQSAAWYRRPGLFAQTDRGATKPRRIRPGDHYGELTVAEDVGRTPNGDVIWKCRCDCGRFAYRTTMILNRSARGGSVSCCSRCLQELAAGRQIEYHDRRHEQMLDLWFERRTLWSAQEVENLKVAIWNDLEEEIGPVRDEAEMPVLEPWSPVRARDIKYAQEQMKRHKEHAQWERDEQVRLAVWIAEQEEREVRERRRSDEVRALELLAETMAQERGITKEDIRANVDEWIQKGICPYGSSIEERAVRAQMVVNGLLAYRE